MAVFVRHKESGKRFLLVGAGFGAWASARPDRILGNILPAEEKGTLPRVAICDAEGNIEWVRSDEVSVVEIDGATPADLLAG